MTESSVLTRPSTPRPAGELVGLHGLKRRWLSGVVDDGLCRSSAAWFTVAPGAPGAQRRATLAACFYHALGLTVVADLAARTAPGGYQALFEEHPDQRPAILAFADEPTGLEVWRRYLWIGPPQTCLTAPYTKVEIAGRTVGPWRRPKVFVPSTAELARIEHELDRGPLAHRDTRLILPEAGGPAATVDTKLARFCGLLADLAEASLFSRRMRSARCQ